MKTYPVGTALFLKNPLQRGRATGAVVIDYDRRLTGEFMYVLLFWTNKISWEYRLTELENLKFNYTIILPDGSEG
jgi:hypothetical protein